MISHYFKLAIRVLLKNKYYTVINVFGLVFGMLSALIIAKYIGGTFLMDNFHQKKNKIYSVTQKETINGIAQNESKVTYWGVGNLLSKYSEVISFSRYSQHVESLIIVEGEKNNRKTFTENRIAVTDSNFLDIFTFPLIYGNPETALSRVNSVLITNTASQKYFGNSNPIGRFLTVRVSWGEETSYEVTGVITDAPQHSQFQFDFLLSRASMNPDEFWYVPDCSIFLLLKDNTDKNLLSDKLTMALDEELELKSTNRKVILSLLSLTAVQYSGTELLLIAIGIFIIIISWTNYINQVIAQSYSRIKEMGIQRAMGATEINFKIQFTAEASLICLVSMLLITGIYLILEPYLLSFTNGHILPLAGDPTVINFIFLAVFIIGTILASVVPAAILFSSNFGSTLINSLNTKRGVIGLRQGLVVVQFSISTILIIGVLVISNQLRFMSNKDKGINMEDILIVKAPIVKDTTWNIKRKNLELFKENCSKFPFVTQVISSTTIPSEEYRQETYLSLWDKSKSMVHQNGVDEHFFDLYKVRFIAGHNFIADAKWKNRSSIILNESAAKALGIVDFDKINNAKITDHESNEVYDLIGIVKDYHQTSLKYEMRPLAFKYNEFRGHFSIKIKQDQSNKIDQEERLRKIGLLWAQSYPDASFEYFFLDEKFAAQDQGDQIFGDLFQCFTGLSIIISCLGLFSLSLLISTRRQKEIGIRKVFGARSVDILGAFLKSYLKPLLMAVLIGTPIAYYLMNTWLKNYAYKIEIGPGLVTLAWLVLTLVFLFTVSYHTIKSSMANPVTILRN